MTVSSNAKIQYESGRLFVDYETMTTTDEQVFTSSGAIWSGKSGFSANIRPNGIITGINLGNVSAVGNPDVVDVSAFVADSKGIRYSLGSNENRDITRPVSEVAKILSYTMTDAGAVAEEPGVDSSDTSFNEVRGSAGGPPLIPVDSVELFQVRVVGTTPAPIEASEIFQVVGVHTERADFPVQESVNRVGEGTNATVAGQIQAHMKLSAPQTGLIHTGLINRKIWISYYSPSLTDLGKTFAFVPAENTHSVNSTEYYGGTVGSSSKSLGQGSFTAILNNGITDPLLSEKDSVITVKFFQDRNETPYILTQGTLGVARTFPVDDQVAASCTISAESPAAEFSS